MSAQIILLIAVIPLTGICFISLKSRYNNSVLFQKKKLMYLVYLICIIPPVLMLWCGFTTIKNNLPVYLEIQKYEIPSSVDTFFIGKDPDKCRVILNDPAADRVHARITRHNNKWFMQNMSSFRRIQVYPGAREIQSSVLNIKDEFSVNGHTFIVKDLRYMRALGWIKIEVEEKLKTKTTNKTIVATNFFKKPVKIGPEFSNNWFRSPIIPLNDSNNKTAAIIKYKNGKFILSYVSSSHRTKNIISINSKLLSERNIELDVNQGTIFCMGRTVYQIKLNDKFSTLCIRPLNQKPRIILDKINETKLVKKYTRPYAASVMDIPFSIDVYADLKISNNTISINNKTYHAGEIISLSNAIGDSIVMKYVHAKELSIFDMNQSAVPGSVLIIVSICWFMLLCGINVFTGTMNIRNIYIYYFLFCMFVLSALISCRIAAFDPLQTKWPSELSYFLITASLFFLIITNFRWLRWPFLRFKYSYFETKYIIQKPVDFENFFLEKVFSLKGIDIYPSTIIGAIVVFLFGIQLTIGDELGVIIPVIGLFQPVFLCEILIVFVVAFWTQRNIEAGKTVFGEAMSSKLMIFLLINRDLLVFSLCFVVLPLYVLRDFSPFLIFSSIILASFCIRPTISVNFRYAVIFTALLFVLIIINFPEIMGSTLESRILVWKNPWIKTEMGFQFIKNLWILKGVGFFGNGLGLTDISVHFPALYRDFMTSLFISDFGQSGLLLLSLIWIIYLGTLFLHSQSDIHEFKNKDNKKFIKSIILWLTFLFMFHTWFIIGSNLGFFPVMGIPLPFLARGYSCLLFLCILGMGICTVCVDELYRK